MNPVAEKTPKHGVDRKTGFDCQDQMRIFLNFIILYRAFSFPSCRHASTGCIYRDR
jgi:hypothetical protein